MMANSIQKLIIHWIKNFPILHRRDKKTIADPKTYCFVCAPRTMNSVVGRHLSLG